MSDTINHLRALLADELTILDIHRACRDHAAAFGPTSVVDQSLQIIEEAMCSHQMRVDILREEIEDLGGEHGDVASRALLGDSLKGRAIREILTILEEYEHDWMERYRQMAEKLDFDVRDVLEGDIIPEQERTERLMYEAVGAFGGPTEIAQGVMLANRPGLPGQKRIFRTRIVLEVLSEDAPVPSNMAIEEVVREMDSGDFIGRTIRESAIELPPESVPLELELMGNDGTFFDGIVEEA